MQRFSWPDLLCSMCGLSLGYQAVAWFWAGHDLTASTVRIGSVLMQGAVGFGLVGWIVIQAIRHARTQERLRAEMIAELRAGRTLPSADPLESLGENIQVRQREKAEAANRARGD